MATGRLPNDIDPTCRFLASPTGSETSFAEILAGEPLRDGLLVLGDGAVENRLVDHAEPSATIDEQIQGLPIQGAVQDISIVDGRNRGP